MASRKSKYAHVVVGLPKYLGEDPERLDLLNVLREEILATPVDENVDWNLSAQLAGRMSLQTQDVTEILDIAKKCPITGAAGLARAYADARVVLDGISEWRSSAQLLVDAYEKMMVDKMEEEGIASVRLTSGASVSTYVEPYGKVVDKEAFRLWCVAPADRCMKCIYPEKDLIHDLRVEGPGEPHAFHPGGGLEKQLQLWPSSMNAVAKERTLAGEKAPDGIEVTVKTNVRLNKA